MEPQLTAITNAPIFDEAGSLEPPDFVIDPDDYVQTTITGFIGSMEMRSPNVDDAIAGIASVVIQTLQELFGTSLSIDTVKVNHGTRWPLFTLDIVNHRKGAE